ncbi:hypothetical protein TB1_024877 [Malus domestica]
MSRGEFDNRRFRKANNLEIGRLKENKTDTDALGAQAQSEMLDAMKRAEDLSSVIKESNSKAHERLKY